MLTKRRIQTNETMKNNKKGKKQKKNTSTFVKKWKRHWQGQRRRKRIRNAVIDKRKRKEKENNQPHFSWTNASTLKLQLEPKDSGYMYGHLYRSKTTSSQISNIKRHICNNYPVLPKNPFVKEGKSRNYFKINAQKQKIKKIHTINVKFDKFKPKEKRRIYFSGKGKDPEGLPDTNAVAWRVKSKLQIIDKNKMSLPSVIVKTDDGKFVVGCVDEKKCAKIFSKNRTRGILNHIIETLGKKTNAARGMKRQPASRDKIPKYYTGGPTCWLNKTGIFDPSNRIPGNFRKEIFRLFQQTELACRSIIDPDFLHLHTLLMKFLNVPGYKEEDGSLEQTRIYSNFACAKNTYLPAHVDEDSFLSSTIVFDSKPERKRKKNQTLAYFCFPDYGVAVPMRHSEVIVFDPWVRHCISSPSVTQDIYCLSFYIKDKLVGGNDNSKHVDETLVQISEKLPS